MKHIHITESIRKIVSHKSSGNMEVEEYVDIRYEFVDGVYVEARTTGSSHNTSVKTLMPTHTITQ